MVRLLVGLIMLSVFLSGCLREKTPVEPSAPSQKPPAGKEDSSPEKPQNTFRNLEYVFFQEGKPRWRVKARLARRYLNRIEMEEPVIVSLEERGLSIRAGFGVYEPSRERFTFRRSVILQTPQKGTLFTEILYYLPRKKLLFNQAPVLVKDKGLVIRGRSFEYHTDTGKMKVRGQTRVEFHA